MNFKELDKIRDATDTAKDATWLVTFNSTDIPTWNETWNKTNSSPWDTWWNAAWWIIYGDFIYEY